MTVGSMSRMLLHGDKWEVVMNLKLQSGGGIGSYYSELEIPGT